ncbi:hypothetical protein [Streptomyces sp. NPDC057877]|uniref:hypothetical protein n=1 Tax=Streptomyces sp. NPDC057877 TaxID=3346269 RepID=UPI00367C7F54
MRDLTGLELVTEAVPAALEEVASISSHLLDELVDALPGTGRSGPVPRPGWVPSALSKATAAPLSGRPLPAAPGGFMGETARAAPAGRDATAVERALQREELPDRNSLSTKFP